MHIEIIRALALAYGPNCRYLEIGVGDGGCLRSVAAVVGLAIGVDVPENPYGFVQVGDARSMYNCGSDRFFEEWDFHQKFDLIFIDGSHWEEQVERDFNNAVAVLAPLGTIAMHDTWAATAEDARHGSDTAWKIAEQLEQADELTWQCYTLPVRPGLTLVRPFDVRPQYYTG